MKKLVYLIAILFVIYSCEKSRLEETPINKEVSMNVVPLVSNVTSKEGRLVFKSKSDFNSAIKMLFDNQKKIKNFESQFPGFTSNKQAYERIDSVYLKSINYDYDRISNCATIRETPEGKTIERVIDMHLLAYLFNDEGILQIGDSIFKFSYDFTFKFNVNKLSQLKSAKLDLSSNDVVAYPNIRSRIELPTNNLKSAQASISEFSYYYTSKKFIKCELNQNITFLHNAITVDTKSRKKNFLGIGFAYQVDELYCGATGYWRWQGLELEFMFDVSDFQDNGTTDVQETIQGGPGPGIPEFVPGTTTGTHGYKYSAGDPFYYLNNHTSY